MGRVDEWGALIDSHQCLLSFGRCCRLIKLINILISCYDAAAAAVDAASAAPVVVAVISREIRRSMSNVLLLQRR